MRRLVAFLAGVVLAVALARADDAYFRVPVGEVKLVEGALPKDKDEANISWRARETLRPYAVLDGRGEAYLTTTDESEGRGNPWRREWSLSSGVLVARAEAGADLTGWMYLPNADWSGLTPIKFRVEGAARSDLARTAFLRAKAIHYDGLLRSGNPGAAWFRHQADEARKALGEHTPDPEEFGARSPSIDDTYDLFTGGRAISENLQLTRVPPAVRNQPAAAAEEKMVALSGVEGITVASIDWTEKLKGAGPKLDALSLLIPADQHVIFFPSFEALVSVLDEASTRALPLARAFAEGSEDAGVLERYQKQLGLHTGAVARLVGPTMIKSVAITGSDPYFPTGTDVAILFQTDDASKLSKLLLGQIRLESSKAPGVRGAVADLDGMPVEGVTTPDRSVCSYVVELNPSTVMVTNSMPQLKRQAARAAGKAEVIAGLPEYKFFRSRYPHVGSGETGFLFLSDATIRRWCGPQWRIGASRRLRAAAILADVTAAHMDEMVGGLTQERPVEPETPMRTIGAVSIGPGGARSSIYGSLAFLTPIAELDLKEAAPDEVEAYRRWRTGYQRNWSWAFDPIALSFTVAPARVSADLSVMPLILGSEYRSFADITRGVTLSPTSADPHDAVFHIALAVNAQAHVITEAVGAFKTMLAPGVEIDPLGWIGRSVAIYADPDPFWAEIAKRKDDSDIEKNLSRMPLALNVEVGSPLKLTAFLAAMRGFIDQSSPGMLAWENREHNGRGYVRIAMSEKARNENGGGDFDKIEVFYAPTPRALIVSLREDVLKRALDRLDAKDKPAPATRPWLGESACLQVSSAYFRGLGGVIGAGAFDQDAARRRAWAILPILNEWKRRFPERDASQVHEAWWGMRPVEPGGGEYRWNEKFRTMESTLYGHPGEPKDGPTGAPGLENIDAANFGITFEDKGLRARAVLERGAKKEP